MEKTNFKNFKSNLKTGVSKKYNDRKKKKKILGGEKALILIDFSPIFFKIGKIK
jgi:hypothetical protein